MRALAIALLLCTGCSSKPEPPATPLARAKQLFGPRQSVSGTDVRVPGAQIFIGTPDPPPADYDGFSAMLLPDRGEPRSGSDAVRFAWEAGVREAAALAQVAALFLGRSQHVATEADKARTYVRDRESIQPPTIADGKLVFWVVRGSMAPTAEPVIVDLSTFERVEPAR